MDSSVQRRSLGVADDFVRSGNGSSGLDLAAVTSLPQPDERSLFCLSVDNPLRALCIQVYTTKKFALAILVVILLNSLLMLVTYSVPCDEKHPCLQEVAYWIDLVFSTCFTLEMLVKIIALGGVLHSQSYFRTGWNVLDFITVIGSLVSLTGAGSNVSILRLLRVLRPLRTMSRVAGLRNLMGALFAAVPEIRDNVILIMFLVIIFGILGVQLFGGALHNRCYIMAFDDTLYPDEVNSSGFMLHGEPPYLLPTSNIHCGGSFSCSQASLAPLNASNVACRRFTSLYEETPLSFDDLGGAILLVFKVFSGDDWPENMVALMNATSPHAWVYFFMCIMVGGLFATNLFLAVLISAYYTNAKKAEDSIEDRQKRAQAAWSRIMSQPLMKAPLSTRRGSVAAGLRTLACTLPLSTASQSRRQSLLHYNAREAADNMRSATGTTSQEEQLMLRIRDTAMLPGSVIIPENDIAFSAKASDHTCRDNENPQRTESNELSVYLPTENIVDDPDIDSGLPPALIPAISTIHAPTAPTSVPSHVCPQPPPITFDSHKPNPPSSECGILRGSTKDLSGTARKRCSFTASLPDDAGLDALPITTHPSHINNDDGFTIQQERESEARNHCEPSFSCNGEQKNAIPTSEAINITSLVLHPLAHLPVSPIMRDSYVDDRESVHGPRRCLFTTQDAIAAVVLHPYSEWFVLSVTFVNVLALALDYYGIDRTFAAVLDWIGMVCTIIFTAEIVLKLFAMGPKNCMSDRYNVFDAFLVGVSLPDLVTGGSSAFSAFRAFRMFRALRYVQRWPSIYNLLLALIGCLNEAMYVALLLLLQIFIFSILGMQLFENRFPEGYRANYDSLWEAALTCFVVITGDAWADVMKEGMLATNRLAAIYFFLLFVVGNYVLVNVVVAVILDKLDDRVDSKESLADDTGRLPLCMALEASINASNTLQHEGAWRQSAVSIINANNTGSSNKEDVERSKDQIAACSANERPTTSFAAHATQESGSCYCVEASVSNVCVEPSSSRNDNEQEDRHEHSPPPLEARGAGWQSVPIDPPGLRSGSQSCLTSQHMHPHTKYMPHSDAHHSPAHCNRDNPLPSSTSAPVNSPQQAAKLEKSTRNTTSSSCPTTVRLDHENEGVGSRQHEAEACCSVNCAKCQKLRSDEEQARVAQEPCGVRCDDESLQSSGSKDTTSQHTAAPASLSAKNLDMLTSQQQKRSSTLTYNWLDEELNLNREKRPLSAFCCYVVPVKLKGHSLYIFSPDNQFRKLLAKIVFSSAFDVFIAAAIATNIGFLACESSQNSDSTENALYYANLVFTLLFLAEMLIKIVVLGLYYPAPPYEQNELPPYLKDAWNRVDFVVVVLALAGLFYKPLSAFRSLRTIRLVIKSSQLRLVISAMLSTLPNITQGLVVCGFIWFVFGVLGTQLFKGKFYSCNDTSVDYEKDCVGSYLTTEVYVFGTREVLAQRAWSREPDHFDNIFSSMYSLFAIAVGEGWAAIMYRGIDATEAGRGPSHNYSPLHSLYFVVFHVVGNFFCLNLIIGILINNFTENRKCMAANDLLTERQRKYVETAELLFQKLAKPMSSPPTEKVRKVVYEVVTHRYFDRLVTAIIILNMFFLGSMHEGQSDAWTQVQDTGNIACTCLFTIEAATKILALSPRIYFADNWNRFDFAVALTSVIGLWTPDGGSLAAVRVLRVGRLLRLVHAAKGLHKLFKTMFEGYNLAYFGNVGLLCVACFFMFGVAGVSMFGNLERTHGLDHNLNFETVPNAMLTLFAISTTEGWLDVRDGLTNKKNCGGEDQGSCGSSWATLYMLAFMITGSFTMLNLFAAVVVELFEAQEAQEKRAHEIDAMWEVRERWLYHFGTAQYVRCSRFCAALFSEKYSLFPARLKRMPRFPRSEDEMENANVACITLTAQPSGKNMVGYMQAMCLPIHLREGSAVVLFTDIMRCLLAKAFMLQATDLAYLDTLPATNVQPLPTAKHRIGHWLAFMILARKPWIDPDYALPDPPDAEWIAQNRNRT